MLRIKQLKQLRQLKELKQPIRKTILTLTLIGALTGIGAGGALGASLTTVDGTVLQLPPGITVFDAKAVETPKGKINLLDAKTLTAVNKALVKTYQDYGKDKKIATLEKFTGKPIRDVDFYQLQGSDAAGHHVAYVFDLQPTGEIYAAAGGADGKTFQPYDAESAYIQYGEYSKQNGGQTIASAAYLQREVKKSLRESKAHRAADLEKVYRERGETLSPEQTKYIMALWDSVDVAYSDASLGKPIHSRMGKGYFDFSRANISVDKFSIPMGVIILSRFTDKGPVYTIAVMNDSSFAYWQSVLSQLWQIR